MKLHDHTLRLSPSDLSNHLSCRHLTSLDLAVARGELVKPVLHSKFLDLLRARGDEHEKAYVAALRARGLTVADLSANRDLSDAAYQATRAAMASGADVIVQAPVGHDGFAGYADLLLRVEVPSALGAWSYVAADTKLARETRGGTILQLCVYSEIVGEYQGRMPESFHVVTPGEPFAEQTYRFDEFAAYYRLVRGRLRDAVGRGSRGAEAPPPQHGQSDSRTEVPSYVPTYPEPAAHCDICRWWATCEARRRADDHLSLVAGIRRTQRAELMQRGVATLAGLAEVPLPLAFKPTRGSREAMERVREQARVQLRGRTTGAPFHELLPVEAKRGLSRLPAPSPGDIFLDLEGDPFVGTGGREYLFGWAVRDGNGSWQYTGRWATDAGSEKAAFEAFMSVAGARRDGAHIYHYAPYEPAALKRLMGRYATCEDALDRLLRGAAFVDLYDVVRQAVICSVERYSIKELEPFYGFTRALPLREASQALREVEYLLETGQPIPEGDPMRAAVESYNRDDCLSAAGLRDWLELLRTAVVASGTDIPRPAPEDPTPSKDTSERDARVEALADRLTSGVSAEPSERTPEQQGRWMLAQLLTFHRREDKAAWWDFFRVADLTDEERLEERSAITGLSFVETLPAKGRERMPRHRYRFPPQECTIGEDGKVYATKDLQLGTVVGIDRAAGVVDIKKTGEAKALHPSSLFANEVISGAMLGDSLERLGQWVAENGLDADGLHRATRDLLLGLPPRISGDVSPELKFGPAYDAEPSLAQARTSALALDGGALPVQGPPGSGKTYTGARMICALVRAGRKVGVTAVSHKVIAKLLDEVVAAGKEEGLAVQCVRKVTDDPEVTDGPIIEMKDADAVVEALESGVAQVAGGTAWLWASEKLTGKVHVLVVDEAGQMALATALACAQAASNLILLGDPQQLEQPLQAAHPDGTDVSVLQHVLGDHPTLPPDRGLFLAETYRMHPALCAFTSELFYENRLRSVDGLDRQVLSAPDGLSGAGLWFVPVQHIGCQNSCPEEVEAVADLVARLLRASWTNREGVTKPMTLNDVLIVAPYNAQVSAIRERLPGARVGTVDRFQGQEAPVVIYSLTTSSPDDAPRGMEFLYSLNRLNVATSRARCAAIVVGNPLLFEPDCQTPRQMRLANALCRFREMAGRLQ
jgi:predicted RecB family nuclease